METRKEIKKKKRKRKKNIRLTRFELKIMGRDQRWFFFAFEVRKVTCSNGPTVCRLALICAPISVTCTSLSSDLLSWSPLRCDFFLWDSLLDFDCIQFHKMYWSVFFNCLGLYSSHLDDAILTIPRKVNHRGEHVSHNLTHHHHELSLDNKLHYHIDFDNETLHLELRWVVKYMTTRHSLKPSNKVSWLLLLL